MYKTVLVLCLIATSFCLGETRQLKIKKTSPIELVPSLAVSKSNGLDWCPQCINTFDDLLQLVLDAILQYGVLNSCGDLCNIVADKSGSELLGFLCMFGCSVLGVEEFAKIMQKADIDPIYYCEEIKLCPVNDDGDAKILSFNMVPQRAPIGSTISIDYVFATKNGTGTGEIILDISTIDKIPLSTGFLLEAQKPGSYGQRVSLDASPDPDCDPTQDECEQWLPGRYNVTLTICNGQCGSHHPHTQIYDVGTSYFDLYE